MEEKYTVFQVDVNDNVAVSLDTLPKGKTAKLIGDHTLESVTALDDIPKGHKIALREILKDEPIVKYGVVIAQATSNISQGSWVHLHNCKSLYDERSSHLDVHTGAPKDTKYE